jgi:ClpP class serine protease
MIAPDPHPVGSVTELSQDGYIAIRGMLTREPVDRYHTGNYLYLEEVIRRNEQDPNVRAIVLDFDCQGGSVHGIDKVLAAIQDSTKPTLAIVSGVCASAAYWIASACSQIIAFEGTEIGSIGTMAVTPEMPPMRVSQYSPRKNAQDEAVDEIVDAACIRFLKTVAANRGFIEEDPMAIAQRVGEGKMMTASEALERGLIDQILAAIPAKKEDNMADKDEEKKDGEAPCSADVSDKKEEDMEKKEENLSSEDIEKEDSLDDLKKQRDELANKLAELEDRIKQLEAPSSTAANMSGVIQALSNKVLALEAAVTKAQEEKIRADREALLAGYIAEGKISPSEREVAASLLRHDRALFDKTYSTRASIFGRKSFEGSVSTQENEDLAAKALEQAKTSGKSFVEIYSAMNKEHN